MKKQLFKLTTTITTTTILLIIGIFSFQSCQKEFLQKTETSYKIMPSIDAYSISIEEVKQLYSSRLNEVELRGGQKTPLNVRPLLATAYKTKGKKKSDEKGKPDREVELVISPIAKDDRIPMNRLNGAYMIFYKDTKGAMKSELVLFSADPNSYKNLVKPINNKDFSGQTIVIDDKDNVVSYEKVNNGVVTHKIGKGNMPFAKLYAEVHKKNKLVEVRCSDPSCYDNFGNSWWQSLWQWVSGGWDSIISIFGSDSGGSSSSVSTYYGNYSDLSSNLNWVGVTTPTSTGGGSGSNANPATSYCNTLASGWGTNEAQLVASSSESFNDYGGYISYNPTPELELREKLRTLQNSGITCDKIYQMSDMSSYASAAYDYLIRNSYSVNARTVIINVLDILNNRPNLKPALEILGEDYFTKFLPANFTADEFAILLSDVNFYGSIKTFLKNATISDLEKINILKDYRNQIDWNAFSTSSTQTATQNKDPRLDLSSLKTNGYFTGLTTVALRKQIQDQYPNLQQYQINISAGVALENAYAYFAGYTKGRNVPATPLTAGAPKFRLTRSDFTHATAFESMNSVRGFLYGGQVEVKVPHNPIALNTNSWQIAAEISMAHYAAPTDYILRKLFEVDDRTAGDFNAAAYTLILPYNATFDPAITKECTRLGVNFYVSYAFIGQNGEVVFSNPERQNNLGVEVGTAPGNLDKGAVFDFNKATIYWRDPSKSLSKDTNNALDGTE